ncbi:hypothetical protein P2318_17815 [Myxococcaceae bacterium GXIMD 01537]
MIPHLRWLIFGLLGALSLSCGAAENPAFFVSLDARSSALQIGGEGQVEVTLLRVDDFETEVKLRLEGLPPGVTSEPVIVGREETHATLKLKATDEVPLGRHAYVVRGSSGLLQDAAEGTLEVQDVPESSRFTFTASAVSLTKGGTADVRIHVERTNFTRAIAVEVMNTPGFVQVAPLVIPYDANEGVLRLKATDDCPIGDRSVLLRATSAGRKVETVALAKVEGTLDGFPYVASISPPDVIAGVPIEFTITGAALGNTSSVFIAGNAGQGTVNAEVISATAGRVVARARLPRGWFVPAQPTVSVTLKTLAGTISQALSVTSLTVDPVNGSDETGRGSALSPFKTLAHALSLCGPRETQSTSPYANEVQLLAGAHSVESFQVPEDTRIRGMGTTGGDLTLIQGPSKEKDNGSTLLLRDGAALERVQVSRFEMGVTAKEGQDTRLPDGFWKQRLFSVSITGNRYGVRILSGKLYIGGATAISAQEQYGLVLSNGSSAHLAGTQAVPVRFFDNTYDAILTSGHLLARHVQLRGSGGILVTSGLTDLGTRESPGNNDLSPTYGPGLSVYSSETEPPRVQAVGNCWMPPGERNFTDTYADPSQPTCGRMRVPFTEGGVTYIDADGVATTPRPFSSAGVKNYVLEKGSIQF